MTTQRLRIEFPNKQQEKLAALLELPETPVLATALFAHCFTCGKDSLAATHISRELAKRGIAVLRFDFTGLGSSEGDFANTHFSSNVEDLLSAADYLRQNYQAPALLVGHSLGGAAVIAAADRIPECQAIATVGAPASPEHLKRHLEPAIPEIEAQGCAQINLGGRPFQIKQQFLDDLETPKLAPKVSNLSRPILILHAPEDKVVGISEGERLYAEASYPKSFVSLDGADHLLGKRADAQQAAAVIAAWATRYLPLEKLVDDLETPIPKGHVRVQEANTRFLRDIHTDHHYWQADEPLKVGGSNRGPDPYELLLSALGACTSMTMRMYANRKGWEIDDMTVELRHERTHYEDCEDCEKSTGMMDVLVREITLDDKLSDEQKKRLLEIADRCPVHRTLENNPVIQTQLKESAN